MANHAEFLHAPHSASSDVYNPCNHRTVIHNQAVISDAMLFRCTPQENFTNSWHCSFFLPELNPQPYIVIGCEISYDPSQFVLLSLPFTPLTRDKS